MRDSKTKDETKEMEENGRGSECFASEHALAANSLQKA